MLPLSKERSSLTRSPEAYITSIMALSLISFSFSKLNPSRRASTSEVVKTLGKCFSPLGKKSPFKEIFINPSLPKYK